jgi:mannosyltransferase OCH1-like enzyme
MKKTIVKISILFTVIILIGVIIFLLFKNKNIKLYDSFSNSNTFQKSNIKTDSNSNSKIPKVLHRTLLWDKEIPSSIKNTYDTFNSQNEQSGWEVKLWRSEDVETLMDKYNLLDIYNSYKLKIQKADLARYVIVYDQGGCYCDFDIESTYNLNDIQNTNESNHDLTLITELCYNDMSNKEMYCSANKVVQFSKFNNKTMGIRLRDKNNSNREEESHRIANYFLMSPPKSNSLWRLIEMAKERSKLETINQYDVLYTTGPALVSSYYDKLTEEEKEKINVLHNKYITHLESETWRNQIKK